MVNPLTGNPGASPPEGATHPHLAGAPLPLSEEQAATWETYRRMSVQLSGRLSRELTRETGLSEADFEILGALAETPGESVRALTLRCGLEWEKSRLSHQLRRMGRRGLISRGDGATVSITEEGLRAVTKARRCHEEAVRRYLAEALSPRQLAALKEISHAVLRALDGVVPPTLDRG